jgi:hypothetical protein
MRGTGQPGDALLAKPEDAGCEATRILINKLNGSMHDPISYQPECIRVPAYISEGVDYVSY